MIPCHGGSPQLSPEHTITVNGTQFKPGDNIEVSLSGPDFEGFFIQARDAEHLDGPAVGSFLLADQRLSQLLTCGRTKGGDDAYLCINEDHRVHVGTAHLTGRSRPLLDSENALEDVSWRLVDGVLQCSFRRSIRLPAYKERFNLDASYYIFLADGEASEGGLIYKHHRQPLITDGLYNVTGPPQDIGGSRSPRLIKAHGALMFVAWITTVSIGVIVARFFKPVWAHSFLFGKEMWFQVTAEIVKSKEYLNSGLENMVTVVTMFLGMDLPALDLPDAWDTYTMIGFVAWHVGVDVLLEIHSYCLIRKVEVIEDDRVQILQSLTSAEAEGHLFKQVVLTIYVCGNIVFLVAFLIAVNNI
ncbi:Ferric-chelate reductase 1 [Pitangus sulphuratus]|nr:Ferric-chelate reductase 1 [Pitangus sulphuratus]